MCHNMNTNISCALELSIFPLSLFSSVVSVHSSPVQVGSVEVSLSAAAMFPAVGIHSIGWDVTNDLQADLPQEDDDNVMMVDSLGCHIERHIMSDPCSM